MPRDDSPIYKIVKDISGGINNRQQGSIIGDNQVTNLVNADLSVLGESRKRPGTTEHVDLGDNDAGIGLFGFMPVGGTDVLVALHNQKMETIISNGTATERKTNFIAGTKSTILSGIENSNDAVFVKVDGNNWFSFDQSWTESDLGDTSTSPPLSDVAVFFRQRLWVLKDNLLYYSTVAPTDMSAAFNRTTNAFLFDVGTEQAIIPLRTEGLVVMGSDRVQAINPSTTPVASDKVENILNIGCVEGKTAVQVGDDILFLAPDGVRALFRSQQDKLQTGNSYPLSFAIKTELEDISWAYINKARAVYFDNKYFLALPTAGSTTNNKVWVYFPASNAWAVIDGWNVGAWAKIKYSGGEEELYYIDNADDVVYQAWTGYDDNGSAITYTEEGRKEDFGKPLLTKTGGEVRIKALAVGNYNLDLSVELDDGGYQSLGTMNLSGDSPELPIALPFNLGSVNIKEEVFHLDEFGPFKQIRLKIEHDDLNGSDEIKIYERTIVTYADQYQSE
jgi:hypothetical protein